MSTTPSPEVTVKTYEALCLIMVAILVIVLNITEIFLLSIRRRPRAFETLLLSLSCADLLFGFTVVVMATAQVSGFENIVEKIHLLYLLFVMTSVLHIFWITLDRLMVLTLPLRIKHLFQEKNDGRRSSSKRIHKILALTWLFSLIVTAAILIDAILNWGSEMNYQINIGVFTSIKFANAFCVPSYAILIFQLFKIKAQVTPMTIPPDTRNGVSTTATGGESSVSNICRKKRGKVPITKLQQRILVLAFLTALGFTGFTMPFAIEMKRREYRGTLPVYARMLLVFNSALNSIFYFAYWKVSVYCQRRAVLMTSSSSHSIT